MADNAPGNHEGARLNEEAARRLIQRATELDASLSAQSSIADLRAAAREAGISDEAFQRALDEVRAPQPVAPVRPTRVGTFAPRKFLVIAAVALILGTLLLFMRRVPLAEEAAAPAAPVVAPTEPPTPGPPTGTPPTPAGPTKAPATPRPPSP
jgi:hypothetical protein